MTAPELVSAVVDSPVPRPGALARDVASRLFPTWQAVLVGAPVAVILALVLGCITALAVALPLGLVVVEYPKPTWFARLSEAAMLPGVALAIWLVVRWMRRRRAAFAELAREGAIVPTVAIAAKGLA